MYELDKEYQIAIPSSETISNINSMLSEKLDVSDARHYRLLTSLFNDKGNVRGSFSERLIADEFNLSLVSSGTNDSSGDLCDSYGRTIECRTITEYGTYLARSSNAGARRDKPMSDEDIAFVRNRIWAFGIYDLENGYERVIFKKGDDIADILESRKRRYSLSKKKACELIFGD